MSTRTRRWTEVAAATAAVYAFVPVALPAWRWLRQTAGDWSDFVALAMMLGVGAVIVARRGLARPRGGVRLLWLLLACVVWVWGLATGQLTPAEKTHFVTYGLLAWVVLRAVEPDVSPPARYLVAALVVGILGWGEEIVQYYMPRRHFEWKDVALNLVAGAVALGALSAYRGDR